MLKPNLLFEQLIAKQDLSTEHMREIIYACMSGQLTDAQIASFLVLMRAKGETENELTAAAKVMQELAHCVDLGPGLIDIVGTGGDGQSTFNVSTASSFVVAAAGIPVAKHGNRSVSSRSGSADLLETAGFMLNLNDNQITQCLQQCHLAFLFAPHYHPAMQHARSARQQLGIRTLFNLLGPLVNPARVKKQVVGVFSKQWLKPLAHVLANLGSDRSLIVSSQDGLDEISIAAPTEVIEYRHGHFQHWQINPRQYGMHYPSLNDIIVGSPEHSLKMIQEVFSNTPGAAKDMVILNAAAALYCAKEELSFSDAIELANATIASGKAAECFHRLKQLTQTLTHQANHD